MRGIGPASQKKLLRAFGSVKGVQNASTEEEKEEALVDLKQMSEDPTTPSSLRLKIQTSLEGFSSL